MVRAMDDSPLDDGALSLQQAADALGVHYMTAYRYVRLGLLEAVKERGAWTIQRAALEALQQGSPTAPVKAGEPAPWSERLETRLVAGDARGAWGIIEAALSSGTGLREVYTGIVSPAMVSIGERWSVGELNVAIEHRASALAMRIIGRIGPRFSRPGRHRGVVVTAAPVGELHVLPLAMISDLLRIEGWEVSDLGANLPSDALVLLLADTPDCVALGLSVTARDNLGALAEACSAVRHAHPDLLIVAGGHAVNGVEHAASLGADAYATDAETMSELVDRVLADS